MTIAGRNKTHLISILIMIIVSSISIIYGIMLFMNQESNHILNPVMLSLIIFPILSLIFLIFIYNMFKQTHAVEIPFFIAFILAIGFESLRLLFLSYNSYNTIIENISLISRVIYFFRLSAIFSIFVSSIFAIKVLSRQTSYVLMTVFFVAFLLTNSMPVNNSDISKLFLSSSNNSYAYQYVLIFASFLSGVNYFIAYTLKNSRVYLKACISICVLIIAYWILLYANSFIALGVGLVLFILGAIFFVLGIHSYHLWE